MDSAQVDLLACLPQIVRVLHGQPAVCPVLHADHSPIVEEGSKFNPRYGVSIQRSPTELTFWKSVLGGCDG